MKRYVPIVDAHSGHVPQLEGIFQQPPVEDPLSLAGYHVALLIDDCVDAAAVIYLLHYLGARDAVVDIVTDHRWKLFEEHKLRAITDDQTSGHIVGCKQLKDMLRDPYDIYVIPSGFHVEVLGGNPDSMTMSPQGPYLDCIRKAHGEHRLVAAIGNGVRVLICAGLVRNHKVTGPDDTYESLLAINGEQSVGNEPGQQPRIAIDGDANLVTVADLKDVAAFAAAIEQQLKQKPPVQGQRTPS